MSCVSSSGVRSSSRLPRSRLSPRVSLLSPLLRTGVSQNILWRQKGDGLWVQIFVFVFCRFKKNGGGGVLGAVEEFFRELCESVKIPFGLFQK